MKGAGPWLAAAILASAPVAAEIADPPVAKAGVLELIEAVRLTLAHDPNIRLQEATSELLRGVLVEQAGAFDLALTGDLLQQFGQQALTNATRETEQDRRDQLQESVDELDAQGDSLEAQLNELDMLAADPTGAQLSDPTVQSQVNLINLLIGISDDPAEQARLTALRDDTIVEQRGIVADSLAAVRQDQSDTQEDLDNLGAVPSGDEDYLLTIDLELEQPLRNGMAASFFLDFDVDGSNFIGRPKASEFGGKGISDFYDATVGFRVDLPLGEGRGRDSAAAGERAATIDYGASLATLRHTASQRVLATASSYWSLVAAQQRRAIFEESVALQGRLVEMVQALIDAGELAPVELARSRAREINARGQLAAARAELHSARLALVQAVGLEARDAERLPDAREAFPEAPDVGRLDEVPAFHWHRDALARRDDITAAQALIESGKVLHEAARIDLKPKVDLELEVSANSIEEDSNVDTALNGVTTGDWTTPSGKASVSVDWAFANRTNRGQREQTAAVLALREIAARDLERTIRSDVLLALENLRHAGEEMRQSSAAVADYREVVAAEVEKLRLGTSTVIDTILTEQRLTDALLSETAAQQRFWQLLAELRFATGTLVEHAAGGDSRVAERQLLSLPAIDGGSAQ
ncbi:MAG: TolC family protein [Acidobacteriota bacterium]